jgi:hypothetical protein
MSKYVNIFSEFIKTVADRLKIPYEKAMKKIETDKALQKEWIGIKSQRKELFVPIRTITRATALPTAMAEELPYAPPPDPLIDLMDANPQLVADQQLQAAHHNFLVNQRQVNRQRLRDRKELRKGVVLGDQNIVADEAGNVWYNIFGQEEEEPPLQQQQQQQQQPLMDEQRQHLLDLIEQDVAQYPADEQQHRREVIYDMMLSVQERAILGLPPTAFQIQMEEAIRQDKLRAMQSKVAGRKVASLGKVVKEKQQAKREAKRIADEVEAKRIADEVEAKRLEDERLALLAAQATATPKKEPAPKKEKKSSSKKTKNILGAHEEIGGVGLTGDMGKMLKHLTSHISDPKEPIDPRDYTQAEMLIKDIKKQKQKEKIKGSGAIVDWESIKWGSFSKQFDAFKRQYPHTTVKDLDDFAEHIIRNPSHFKERTKKRARFYQNVLTHP